MDRWIDGKINGYKIDGGKDEYVIYKSLDWLVEKYGDKDIFFCKLKIIDYLKEQIKALIQSYSYHVTPP